MEPDTNPIDEALPKGHILDGGQELKACPGTPRVPAGYETSQPHYAPVDDFGANVKNADGLARLCKSCTSLFGKAVRADRAADKPARVNPNIALAEQGLRHCIGSGRYGFEPHDAPIEEFPAQPSQPDGLGRMCKTHWNQYTAGLARDRKGSTPKVEKAPKAEKAAPATKKSVAQAVRDQVRNEAKAKRAEKRKLSVVAD